MSLITAHALAKYFGGRLILHDLDLALNEGARLGLVGANGSGKSTLLRLLAGLDDPNGGEIARKRGLRVAYLPQDLPGDERSALETLRGARPDLEEIERALTGCETELATPAVMADLRRIEQALARQEQLLRRFEELGGPGFEGEARAHLRGLGLDDDDIARPTKLLSGGQRKLVGLASCLAQRPDLLLLDEPETHLDLPHREQLERYVRAFDGGVLMVSHDRYLLDETVSQIAELDQGKITLWPGNYSAYALAREVKLRRQQELFVSQQKEIARLEAAIARFKLWADMVKDERHIKQARNKQRQIDAMDKIEKPVLQRRRMALELRAAECGGQKALELRDVSMAFGDNLVLLGASALIQRGERVGIVGANGTGKSVLGKLLAGLLEPTEGTRWQGPSVEVGYFAQGNETLPSDVTPVELVRLARPQYEEQAVALLGKFLFTYEQARQPVRALSGGERSRLQLVLLMMGHANCLVLDEPTNHLDIDSVEVLEGALERFEGTVIVISHDRYFLDRIADRIFEVRDGELLSHDGGYSAWLAS
ncbi:MAG TPA: ABC-F family ATP-binding cassette domain-containing protein [Ktedonobacterales bacterium]|nr:ABC-F family ATP-binding cassette domain-containing protein [Ktedonobacterales bacterium]